MGDRDLHVLIVSRAGVHQKAIQAVCASTAQFSEIETANTAQQALEMLASHRPALVILGANLGEHLVCDLVNKIKSAPNPPYCIALTLIDFDNGLGQRLAADKILATGSFANKLPEILSEAAQV